MFLRSFFDSQIDIDKYKKVRQINKGSHGIVYLVQNVENGQIYAAKYICCNNKDLYKKIIDQYIEMMIYLKHPTLIDFVGYSLKDFQNENNILIFMELAENGSLLDLNESIQKNDIPKEYSNTTRQIILVGISRCMKYLHDRNIIHGNLKLGNVLLDREFHPHISDFGLSKLHESNQEDNQTGRDITIKYLAPEIIDGGRYDKEADVYSFGILMYEIISNKEPYPELVDGSMDKSSFSQKLIKENYRPQFNFPIKKSIRNLIEQCLSGNREERPTFKEIFNKLAYGKNENEEEDNIYYLEDVDISKIMIYVNDITEITDPIEKLNNQLDKLLKENKQLNKDKEILEEKNQKLATEKDSLFMKSSQLINQNQQLTGDIEELITEKKKLFLENNKLSTTNKHLSINNSRLLADGKKIQTENDKLTVQNSYLSVNNQHLINDNNHLQTMNKQMKENNLQLLNQNDILIKDNEQFSRDKKQLILKNNELTKNNVTLKNENEILLIDNNKIIFENKKLTKDNKQLLTLKQLSDNKKEQLSNSIEMMKEQIRILSIENEELSTDLQNIINEYEIQIISKNELKFIREMNNINIKQFNSFPLMMQKLIISDLISKSNQNRNRINQTIIKMNNLILFLLRFDQFKILKCFEINTEDDDQLLSGMNCRYSILIHSDVMEILYSMNLIMSYEFISILKKFDEFQIILKYPIDSFNQILSIISNLKTNQFINNQFQISIFISRINELDSIFKNNGMINFIRFDSFVQKITSASFINCTSLKGIQFDKPSSLLSIDNSLFKGCFKLTSIEIPSSVTKLCPFSFLKCSSLTEITIPPSVIEIEEGCFMECKSIQKVEFSRESKLKLIGVSCFCKCSSLKEICIPSLVTEIKKETFSNCASLSKVIVSVYTVKFSEFAFYRCSSLKEINIPPSVTEIGSNSFHSCTSLRELIIPSSVIIIGVSAFAGCSKLINVTIPSSVTQIGESAFIDCSSLTHISFPSSISMIADSTFQRCSSLRYVDIPFSVESIGALAFNGCSSLHNLEVPYSVETVGFNAFPEGAVVRTKYTIGRKIGMFLFRVLVIFWCLCMIFIIFAVIFDK